MSKPTNSALSQAIKFLSIRGYSKKELTSKLQHSEYTDEAIQQTIAYLVERGYLNDTALCKMLYEKYNAKKYGLKAISYKLIQHGIPKEIINDIVSEHDAEEEWQKAMQVVTKKATSKTVDRNKIARYLAYRGFSTEIIKKAIMQVEEDSDLYDC